MYFQSRPYFGQAKGARPRVGRGQRDEPKNPPPCPGGLDCQSCKEVYSADKCSCCGGQDQFAPGGERGKFGGYFSQGSDFTIQQNLPTNEFLNMLAPAGTQGSYIYRGMPAQQQQQTDLSSLLYPALAIGAALVLFSVMK